METITRQAADAVKAEMMQTVTAGDVVAKLWRFYDAERTSAARESWSEGNLRTRAIFAVYWSGVHDALQHITKPEYVPVDEPDEEEMMEG